MPKMKKLEKLAAKAVNAILDIEIYGWPPVCFGTFFQPERPEVQPNNTSKLSNETPVKEGRN